MHLTGKEYLMALTLARNPNATVTKDRFLDQLYGGMDEPELKIIDVFICKLRKKFDRVLGDGAGHEIIQTVWGLGYNWRLVKRAEDSKKKELAKAV